VRLFKLGTAQQAKGEFAEAAEVLREAQEVHAKAVEQVPHLEKEHHYWRDAYREAALLAGARPPEDAEEHLTLAYAFRKRREHLRAAEQFERALRRERPRADLGRANLFHAACAAAQVKGPQAERWRAQALEWLAEDLRLRRTLVAQIESRLASDLPPERRKELQATREAQFAHIERARTKEPDLAPLRGTAEFQALFVER
jgi:hypothetical protein